MALRGLIDALTPEGQVAGWVVDDAPAASPTPIRLKVRRAEESFEVVPEQRRGAGGRSFKLSFQTPVEAWEILSDHLSITAVAGEETLTLPVFRKFHQEMVAQVVSELLAARQAGGGAPAATPDVAAASPKQLRAGPPKSADDLSYVACRAGMVASDRTAVLGREGTFYVYHGSNSLLEMYEEDYPEPRMAAFLRKWRETCARRVALCQELEARYLQMFIPEKSSVIPDHFPQQIRVPTPWYRNLEQTLLAALPDATASLLFLMTPLASDPQRLRLFSQTDSHFSPTGSAIAIRSILARLELLGVELPELVRDIFAQPVVEDGSEYVFSGDLTERFFGVPLYEARRLPSTAGAVARFGAEIRTVERSTPANGRNMGTRVVYANPGAPIRGSVVAFGNSFCGVGTLEHSLSWWFKHLFAEYHFVWAPGLDEEYLRRVRPDIVIGQSIERFFRVVPGT
jgi:hypothetical protein